MSELALFIIACFFILVFAVICWCGLSNDEKENECQQIYKTDAAGEFGKGWTNFSVCPNCGVAILHGMQKKDVKINCHKCGQEMMINKSRERIEAELELQQKKLKGANLDDKERDNT